MVDFRLPIADLVFGFWSLALWFLGCPSFRSEGQFEDKRPKTKGQRPNQIDNWQSEIGNP
jgi:hypothetical protein